MESDEPKMYCGQLIAFHGEPRCGGGAPEHKVIESIARARGVSLQDAAREVEMAVLMNDLVRVSSCKCR